MTRRSSTRALAQEIYRAMPAGKSTPTPDPSPHASGRGRRARGKERPAGGGQSLTERVRALYEDSAVPVREIASLAGVTERTIYKYAAKHRWKPRYAWTPDGARPRAWRAGPSFAPAKGAGGRFVRRADKGKPFAVGLKATDRASRRARRRGLRARRRRWRNRRKRRPRQNRCFEDTMRAHARHAAGAGATAAPSRRTGQAPRRRDARRPTISFAAHCR